MTAETTNAETPLGAKLKARIRRDGPIDVSAYMLACLADPEHGYYKRRSAIGAAGDFVTAPEISQVFGELIGLWCAVVWQQMGSPGRVNLVELGAGRGTMMRDALRAARLVPAFRSALSVHLVDSNETLRDLQRVTLAECGVPVHFHGDAVSALTSESHIPDHPTIVLANEFLDALPVAQFVYAEGDWRARKVTVDAGGALQFTLDRGARLDPALLHETPTAPRDGDILEVCADHEAVVAAGLRSRASLAPLAALFLDYGHTATGFGDTLQGVAGQKHVSPFHRPGETDLSAQVDFQSFTKSCAAAGLAVDGPMPQAEFLGRLGIIERASRLMSANPAMASEIEAGVARLIAPTGMGSRFLVLGVRSPALPPLPAFEQADA